jgi:N-acetylglucosaminyl-diphospho-decaprenol L-rhamnosyltransferase
VCAQVVCVVVTHHGPGPRLRRCLDSLAGDGAVHPVIVVDNGDHDTPVTDRYGTGVTDVLRVPNHGYGAAANAGVARARSIAHPDVRIALLNDDVEVDPGWLVHLGTALDEDDELGAVQPKLLLDDGRTVNSVGVELDETGAGSDVGFGEPDDGRWDEPIDIVAFTGGAVLFRAAFLDDTGGFDERYFMYYEDVDLALRGAELGWRYRCIPAARVTHDRGSSSASLGDEVHFVRERNRLWTAFRFADAPTIGRATWLGVRRVRHRPRWAHARGLAAGLAGAPRRVLERRRVERRR